jgi:hypothetical protein
MRHRRQSRGIAIAAAATVALAATGVAAYAAVGAGSNSQSSPIEALKAGPAGPGRLAQAYNLSATAATPVFVLRDGETVSVVQNASAKCLLRSSEGRPAGEACDTLAAIAEGQGISVTDECGTISKHLMEITGLAPEGVSTVRLDSSDGTYQSTAVVGGAFKFEGTNPQPAEPYPTGVEWVASDGAYAGTAPLPVEGERFCIPTS